MYYPEPLNKLIVALGKLPGVGPKTAQRLAFHLLNAPAAEAENLAAAILEARRKTHYCSVCGNLTDRDPCLLCTDPERDQGIICVVEEARDIVALEKTRQYRGLYHVLQGSISPVDGIGPDQLRVKELLRRLQGGKVKEVVLATNADVEGEATALYLARLLKPMAVRVTRLAYGLPVGSDLEYADEITLARAFSGRHEME
ncbi:Recombination protein RecR [Neomoorella glycerini]|uniref:Recombination protein RecR n=1 Tax=Neomoorella glycerini TaxID=55779 RepID=A0A6I5ZR89_9FIRM|nr:recombination mediator RecR [Moorella glycerini]QGP91991.1 Recombination protein RecR [Moorella glycerini]